MSNGIDRACLAEYDNFSYLLEPREVRGAPLPAVVWLLRTIPELINPYKIINNPVSLS